MSMGFSKHNTTITQSEIDDCVAFANAVLRDSQNNRGEIKAFTLNYLKSWAFEHGEEPLGILDDPEDRLETARMKYVINTDFWKTAQHVNCFTPKGFPNTGDLVPVKKVVVYQLHSQFNVSLKKFLIKEKDENSFFSSIFNSEGNEISEAEKKLRSQYFLNKDWDLLKNEKSNHGNPAFKVISVPIDSITNDDLFSAYAELTKRIDAAEQTIVVWENTFKGDNNNPGNQKAYNKAQALIFNKIFDKLDKEKSRVKRIKYKRIFNFSIDSVFEHKNIYFKLLDEVSYDCLDHMLKCIRQYPSNCEFKISKSVSRFRGHCLIDSSIMLTEDYIKFGENVIPRVIFIDDASSSVEFKIFISSLEEDNNRSGFEIIDLESLENSIFELIDYYKKLEAGERFVTRIMKILRKETASIEKKDSKLINFLYPFLESAIYNEYGTNNGATVRLEKIKLGRVLKNPDQRVFSELIGNRNAYTDSIKRRIEALKAKANLLKGKLE
jgi:hypothetical protein